MEITCENETKHNGIKGSVVTIKADDGSVVEEINLPVRYGLDYCERHPNGKYGRQFREALEKAKGDDKKIASEAATTTPKKRRYTKGTTTRKYDTVPATSEDWFEVDPDNPPKRGDYWVTDGKKVWALNISKPTQLSSLVSILGVQYLKPISERKPKVVQAH